MSDACTSVDIRALLQAAFPDAVIGVEGEGCNLTLNFESASLMGLSPVKRQQAVYQHLSPLIASGALHAVSMTFRSPGK